MADNKKYYYIKLKENFFETEEMIVLESMPDGYKYSNILLKMYLKSLKHDGKVMLNERIPYNSNMLSSVTRHSVGDVEKSIKIFRELGLIETFDNGTIFISDIQQFIGKSSTEAERKKEYRERIKTESLKINGQMSGQMSDVSTPELEIELELEKELEKEIEKDIFGQPDRAPYKDVIDYLNQKADKQFRKNTSSTQKVIKARFKEGFTIEDFKKVIDNKTADWLNDKKMSEYLRPQTLFGADKFEGYLNQESKAKKEPAADRYDLKQLSERIDPIERHATDFGTDDAANEDDFPF
ncbi:phage replisome organizer N-terminal domain-containing protein [Carnobacterium pleistocenium]|uniref:phage replisome organizer N-terminal domain-containing protein n=1 Tax=Carnobacterium pleistocenium TaxID=181073 RepID=UPI00068DE13F|nr:phage replisome organizer N-terminal domain-containing protein [Carnobacterium pleistocenium]